MFFFRNARIFNLRLCQHQSKYFVFVSDSFIDSSISSKFNGQAGEKELQPWDAEGPSEGAALEAIESPAIGTPTTTGNDNSVSIAKLYI